MLYYMVKTYATLVYNKIIAHKISSTLEKRNQKHAVQSRKKSVFLISFFKRGIDFVIDYYIVYECSASSWSQILNVNAPSSFKSKF